MRLLGGKAWSSLHSSSGSNEAASKSRQKNKSEKTTESAEGDIKEEASYVGINTIEEASKNLTVLDESKCLEENETESSPHLLEKRSRQEYNLNEGEESGGENFETEIGLAQGPLDSESDDDASDKDSIHTESKTNDDEGFEDEYAVTTESKFNSSEISAPEVDFEYENNDIDEYSVKDLKSPTSIEDKNDITQEELILSEKQIQEMWAGKSNVLVAVRVRPLNNKELLKSKSGIKVLDGRIVVVTNKNESLNTKNPSRDVNVLRQHRSKEKRYAFDFAFGPETSTTTVYNHTTKFLIDGVIVGYNATVFAYGATGAGKTYTMLGNCNSSSHNTLNASNNVEHESKSPGIMLLTLRDLFKRIEMFSKAATGNQENNLNVKDSKENSGIKELETIHANKSTRNHNHRPFSATTPSGGIRQYRVTCSFVEVYNEMIRDLLTPSSECLDLREDPVKGPIISGLSEVEAFSAQDVMLLLKKGNSRRTTEGTAANEASSRSHAVLQITVEKQDDGVGKGALSNVTIGKLSLIDLAGSERASVTQNRGIRLVEGANINRSLLALGNCINALREGGKGAFVPYRDSKLTRLLKDSLGGNCRTVMIAAVSPAKDQQDETLNTLKYANRAKNIKTQVERNVLNVDYHVSEYVNLIGRLKNEISTLRSRLNIKKPPAIPNRPGNGALTTSVNAAEGKKSSKSTTNRPNTVARKSVEKQQMSLLREQLVLNFKERMQLRRSLIEIEAQNIANNNELEMLQLTINRWTECLDRKVKQMAVLSHEEKGNESDTEEARIHNIDNDADDESIEGQDGEDEDENNEMDANESEVDQDNDEQGSHVDKKRKRTRMKKRHRLSVVTEPESVRSARIEISQLQRANLKNSQAKIDIERRLTENEKASSEVRRQMDTRITSEERRELMELEYRIGMLELENMELERSRMVHRSCMNHKDLLIKRLFNQLQLRDTIVNACKGLLSDNGVLNKTVENALEAHVVDLEPIHMLKSLPTGAPPTPGTGSARGYEEKTSQHSNGDNNKFDTRQERERHESTSWRNKMSEPPKSSNPWQASKSKFIPSSFGLPSPATDRQMFPMDRLEEELLRIELSNAYVRTPDSGSLNNKSELHQITEELAHIKDKNRTQNGTTGTILPRSDKERRKMRRIQNLSNYGSTSAQNFSQIMYTSGVIGSKKTHPFLRHHKKKERSGRARVRRRSSNVRSESSLAGAAVTNSPTRRRSLDKTSNNSIRYKKRNGRWPERIKQNPGSSSSAANLKRPTSPGNAISELNGTSSSSSLSKHRILTNSLLNQAAHEGESKHKEEELLARADNENSLQLLPPLHNNSHIRAEGKDIVVDQISTLRSIDRAHSLTMEGLSRMTAVVAPAPSLSLSQRPSSHEEKRSHKLHANSSNSTAGNNPKGFLDSNQSHIPPRAHTPEPKHSEHYQQSKLVELGSLQTNSANLDRKQTLNRLNSKMLGSFESKKAESKSDNEFNDCSDSLELLSNEDYTRNINDSKSVKMPTTDTSDSNDVTEKIKSKAKRKEKKKLERKLAELNFVLRRTINSPTDIREIRDTALDSIKFLDRLDKKAKELNVLRGTLSRMLLPYSENTAAATQRANTPVTGDSPLDSVMDLNTRKEMVASANQLRSLVRVKIADDADLDQARTACEETVAFFKKLEAYAKSENSDPYDILTNLKRR